MKSCTQLPPPPTHIVTNAVSHDIQRERKKKQRLFRTNCAAASRKINNHRHNVLLGAVWVCFFGGAAERRSPLCSALEMAPFSRRYLLCAKRNQDSGPSRWNDADCQSTAGCGVRCIKQVLELSQRCCVLRAQDWFSKWQPLIRNGPVYYNFFFFLLLSPRFFVESPAQAPKDVSCSG